MYSTKVPGTNPRVEPNTSLEEPTYENSGNSGHALAGPKLWFDDFENGLMTFDINIKYNNILFYTKNFIFYLSYHFHVRLVCVEIKILRRVLVAVLINCPNNEERI